MLEVLALARAADDADHPDVFIERLREVTSGMRSSPEVYVSAATALIVLLADQAGPTRAEALNSAMRAVVEEAAQQGDSNG